MGGLGSLLLRNTFRARPGGCAFAALAEELAFRCRTSHLCPRRDLWRRCPEGDLQPLDTEPCWEQGAPSRRRPPACHLLLVPATPKTSEVSAPAALLCPLPVHFSSCGLLCSVLWVGQRLRGKGNSLIGGGTCHPSTALHFARRWGAWPRPAFPADPGSQVQVMLSGRNTAPQPFCPCCLKDIILIKQNHLEGVFRSLTENKRWDPLGSRVSPGASSAAAAPPRWLPGRLCQAAPRTQAAGCVAGTRAALPHGLGFLLASWVLVLALITMVAG